MDKELCAFCKQLKELQVSHIIPKFVFKWHIKNEQGPMRLTSNPNKRIQDAYKFQLLCKECEQRFSEWEKLFREKMFIPYKKNGLKKFVYGDWLLKFSISLSWRCVIWVKKMSPKFVNSLSKTQVQELELALIAWRSFLLGEIKNPKKYSQHLLVMDLIKSTSKPLPKRINSYISTVLDLDLVCNSVNLFVYVKIFEFVFVSPILVKNPSDWKFNRICVERGKFDLLADITLPNLIWTVFKTRSELIHDEIEKISDNQKQIIQNYQKENHDSYEKSNSYKANKQDILLQIQNNTFRNKNDD